MKNLLPKLSRPMLNHDMMPTFFQAKGIGYLLMHRLTLALFFCIYMYMCIRDHFSLIMLVIFCLVSKVTLTLQNSLYS